MQILCEVLDHYYDERIAVFSLTSSYVVFPHFVYAYVDAHVSQYFIYKYLFTNVRINNILGIPYKVAADQLLCAFPYVRSLTSIIQ